MKGPEIADKVGSDFPILSTTIGEESKPLIYCDSAATSQRVF